MKFNSAMLRAYLVGGTQDTNNDPAEFLAKVEQAMRAGITAFQYREKDGSTLDEKGRLTMATRLRQLCIHYQLPYFIDDDEELALTVGADGVHVGQKDQRIEQVIKRAQGRLMIGYSCNQPSQIVKANELAAVDYIGSGPVFPTNSKADADPVISLAQLRKLNQLSKHPLVAIGGITEANVAETLQTGVSGVAVISMILQSADIKATVQKMLAASQNS